MMIISLSVVFSSLSAFFYMLCFPTCIFILREIPYLYLFLPYLPLFLSLCESKFGYKLLNINQLIKFYNTNINKKRRNNLPASCGDEDIPTTQRGGEREDVRRQWSPNGV